VTPAAPALLEARTQRYDVIRFIERSCVRPDGPLIGKPRLLRDWQERDLLALFQFEPVVDDERVTLPAPAIAEADGAEIRWRQRYAEALAGLFAEVLQPAVLGGWTNVRYK